MDSILSHLTSSLFQSDRIYNETSTPAPEPEKEQTETIDPVVEKPPEEDGAEVHQEDEEDEEEPEDVRESLFMRHMC